MGYDELVESWIGKIDERLSGKPNAEMDKSLAKDVVSVFSDEIEGIKTGLDRYRGRVYLGGIPVQIDDRGDLVKLKGKLEMHLAKRAENRSNVDHGDGGATPTPSIHIENNPQFNVTTSSTSNASLDADIEIVNLIYADSNLSSEEKDALRSLLKDAESDEAKYNSGVFARIGSKIMEGVENATPGVVSGAIGYLASLAEAYFGT